MGQQTELKTISEICIEIDECDEMFRLDQLCKYLRTNCRKYSLIHLRFIKEHFDAKMKAIARRDALQFKNTLEFLGFRFKQ